MKLQRILALLFGLCILVSMIAGCSAKTEDVPEATIPGGENTDGPAPTDDENPSDLSGILPLCDETESFTMLYPFFNLNPSDPNATSDFQNNPVMCLMEELTNIHIEIQDATMQTYSETLNTVIASGEYPDLFSNFGRFYAKGLTVAIDEEIIVDIAQYKDDMPNYVKEIEENGIYKELVNDEGQMGMAYSFSEVPTLGYGLIARQDWLDKLGISKTPATIDEIHEYLKAANSQYDAVMWLGNLGSYGNSAFGACYGTATWSGSTSLGSIYMVRDGLVEFGPASEGYKDYIALLSSWYEEGLIDPDFVNEPDQAPKTDSVTEGVALWAANLGSLGEVELLSPDGTLREVPIANPTLNEGESLDVGITVSHASAGIAVSTQCENVSLIAKWLDCWYTEQGTEFVSWGIRGDNFDYDEDGHGFFIDPTVKTTAINTAPGKVTYESQLAGWTDLQAKAVTTWSENYDLENIATYPETTASMTSDELDDYSNTYIELVTYVQEMTLRFIVGDNDYVTEWDTFIQTLEEMNVDQCVQYKQAAYDRYIGR